MLVRVVGLEPTSITALEPKSSMFTNFIIPAYAIFTISDGNSYTEGASPKSVESTNSTTPAYLTYYTILPSTEQVKTGR